LLAAAIAALAGFAAVYVTLGRPDNAERAGVQGPPPQSRKPGEAPAGLGTNLLSRGQMAAFVFRKAPEDLPEVKFLDAAGQERTLADWRGKVVLLNLWATWCLPCRKEMPALDRLQAELGGADFAVVPVSIDTGDPQRPAEFLRSVGVTNLPLYTDRSTAIFQDLKHRGMALGLPVSVLIDRNGCRLGHMNAPAEWDSAEGKRLIEAAIAWGRVPTS
jgi:thiol-disulfide isomerase/thioredoxin